MIFVSNEFLDYKCCVSVNRFVELNEDRTFELSIVFCHELNLYILCLYRASAGDIREFLCKLETVLSQLTNGASIILCGDFNIDYLNKSHVNTLLLSGLLNSFDLRIHNSGPTRCTPFSSTMTDYCCSNLTDNDVQCQVINAGLSDHNAIFCKLKIKRKHNITKRIIRRGRIYSKGNFDIFFQQCCLQDWQSILTSSHPLENFHSILFSVFNNAFPPKVSMSLQWICAVCTTLDNSIFTIRLLSHILRSID